MGSYYTGNASSYGSSYSSYGNSNYGGYGHNSYSNSNYNVTVPPLPYQDNYYQLPDVYQQGGTGYINNYYNQNAYFNDQVVVNDYYNVQPYHNREYIYGGTHTSVGNLISTTSGCIPQFQPPSIGFSYGGGYANTSYPTCNYGCDMGYGNAGGYMQNTMMAPGGAYMSSSMWG
ncbi:MAG: hypothetical protein U0003_02510 [Vampirovibrionales bacterium]